MSNEEPPPIGEGVEERDNNKDNDKDTGKDNDNIGEKYLMNKCLKATPDVGREARRARPRTTKGKEIRNLGRQNARKENHTKGAEKGKAMKNQEPRKMNLKTRELR